VHGVPRRRLLVSAVVVATTALALPACSGGSAEPPPTTSSTTATVPGPSASLTPEQQAAEEAKAALLSYHEAVDSVYQAGGQDPDKRLAEVAVGKQLDFLTQDAARLRKNHWRQVGSTLVKNLGVESVQLSATSQVVLNLCLDASKTDGVDAEGKSIREPDAYAFFEAQVTLVRQQNRGWLVSREDDKPVKSC
jgi:hypothetical protein